MKFFYGLPHKKIDITVIVFTKCKKDNKKYIWFNLTILSRRDCKKTGWYVYAFMCSKGLDYRL